MHCNLVTRTDLYRKMLGRVLANKSGHDTWTIRPPDWTLVLTDPPRPQLGSYLVEFSMEFVHTVMLHVSLFGGQSIRTGMQHQLGYARVLATSGKCDLSHHQLWQKSSYHRLVCTL
jgi:hypothetical protein